MAATFCSKPKNSCHTCPHFRYDYDRTEMVCWMRQDQLDGFNYKGYDIEPMYNKRAGYTVNYCGDEVFFDTIEQAVCFINEISESPMWDVTFIWGNNLKMMTLTVSADDEEEAVRTAFDTAGSNFENRLISVKRRQVL